MGVRDFFLSLPLFANLPRNEIEMLTRFAHLREYKKGEHVYRQGDEADRLSIVRDGWIRLYRGNAEGDEGTSQLLTNGDVLGERVILPGDMKHFYSAQAIGDSRTLSIPASAMRDLAQRNSAIVGNMMQGVMDRMGRLHVESEHMALFSTPQRVACLLLRLSSHMVGKGGTFTFPYDKSLAAAQLGMKRETFSRALGALRRFGTRAAGPEIEIDNFVRLSESCCPRCSLSNECRAARCMASARAEKTGRDKASEGIRPPSEGGRPNIASM